jgi:hypothetical protein
MAAPDFIVEPIQELALRLVTTTDDEVFGALETASRSLHLARRDAALSRIVLIETEIEWPFPGQILALSRLEEPAVAETVTATA